MRVNLGTEAVDVLSSFLNNFDELEHQHAGESAELDWFSPDRVLTFCFLDQSLI